MRRIALGSALTALLASGSLGCEVEPNPELDGSSTRDASGSDTSTSTSTSQPDGTTTNPDGGDPSALPPSVFCPRENDPRCGLPFDPNQALAPAELEQALEDGLRTWRKQGNGGACAHCHSPDGIEVARVGYNDEDVERRALDHLTQADADVLVKYVAALRQKHNLTALLHPDRYRPLQPAGEPFASASPIDDASNTEGQVERDHAFMRMLVDELKLTWAREKITDLDKAKQAYAELLALDVSRMKIGIPFDRLSEDKHHGDKHASVFEWFPGIPSGVKPGAEDDWYDLVDVYLADPSDENLWRYYDAIDESTLCDYDLGPGEPAEYQRACDWMRLKWKSLQLVQHMLRHDTTALPDPYADQPASAKPWEDVPLLLARQPIWEAGDHLRVAPLQRPTQTACFTSDSRPCTILPPDIDATVTSLPSYEQARIIQSRTFQQSWFVMSWLRDPALLHQGESFETFIGDYLEAVLLQFYDVHHAFVVMKTAVAKSAAKDWLDAPGFRNGTGKIASIRTFSFKQLRNNFSPPPEDDPRRRTHDTMFANFARMWIFLVEDDLNKTGEIYDRLEVLRAVRFMRTWVAELEGREDLLINQTVQTIERRAKDAKELRSDANREAFPGTGLQPNGTWRDFDEPYQLPE